MSKDYLIIGASSDVGLELIKELISKEKNVNIWAHYCSNDIMIREIEEKNGNTIIPIKADFSKHDDIDYLYSTICASGKVPTSIVHLSAPKLKYEKFKNLSWEECIRDVEIQVGAVFKLLQMFLPKMIKMDDRAKIVFMLSENTINMPAKFSTKYTMSKYMLLGLMKSISVEYEGKNVNVNALSPSMIDTKFLSGIDRRILEISGATEHILKPKDVVQWLLRLMSEYSDMMNGENILFSGGDDIIE